MKKDKNHKSVSSVSDYIEYIYDLRQLKMSEFSLSSYWFFRGQKNSLWGIKPNIFRNDMLQYEFDSIEAALRQRPYDFQPSTNFDILTKLQHYGLGTRLLDVTLNPLVALYFASEKHEEFVPSNDGQGQYIPRDGKIVYSYSYGHKLSELEVKIACALPFIEFTKDFTLSDLLKELHDKKVITQNDAAILEKNNYEKFIRTIQNNNFVVSPYSNERLTRQNGAFIIPTAIKIIGDNLYDGNCLVRKAQCDLDDQFDDTYFIIPAEKKDSIRDELDFLNINEATLFPELEHQLAYLQNRKPKNPGQVEIYEPFSWTTTPSENNFTEKTITPHSEPHPNIPFITNKYLLKIPDLAKEIARIIEEGTSTIDWWLKSSVISQMNRDITRKLQTKISKQESKVIANNIVKEVLTSPT